MTVFVLFVTTRHFSPLWSVPLCVRSVPPYCDPEIFRPNFRASELSLVVASWSLFLKSHEELHILQCSFCLSWYSPSLLSSECISHRRISLESILEHCSLRMRSMKFLMDHIIWIHFSSYCASCSNPVFSWFPRQRCCSADICWRWVPHSQWTGKVLYNESNFSCHRKSINQVKRWDAHCSALVAIDPSTIFIAGFSFVHEYIFCS